MSALHVCVWESLRTPTRSMPRMRVCPPCIQGVCNTLGEWRMCIHCTKLFVCTCIHTAVCFVRGAERVHKCVCLLFGTTISAYMHTSGAEHVCFVCSPVGVCHLCWERRGYGLYTQAGVCTHVCLREVSVCTHTVNSSAGAKGAFWVSSRQ